MPVFRDIEGCDNTIEHLQNAIRNDRISHAYLFVDDTGEISKALAHAFAQTLQCSTVAEGLQSWRGLKSQSDLSDPLCHVLIDGCGRCPSCRRAESRNHPDIIEWTHQKPKTFGAEDARDLVEDVAIRPFSSDRKIYIVPDAHLMTAEAQNTLLKTLEEPPEYVVIILLSASEDALLETIRSRCVIMDLASNANIHTGAIAAAEREAAGKLALDIVTHIHEWSIQEIMGAVKDLSVMKVNIESVLDIFTAWYRDVLYLKATNDASGILHSSLISEVRKEAQVSSYGEIQRALVALETAKARRRANVNLEVTMEMLLLAMKGETLD